MSGEFVKGIIKENPLFVIVLGLCPSLAVTYQVNNALAMGVAVMFVLLGSNIFIALLKDFIPDKVRIPCYVVIIASFVTIVEMVMEAYVPALYKSLGIFIPLIVVNCIILGRAEVFANKNSVFLSILDALGMGIGFMLAIIIISLIREILGNGTITLFPLFGFNGVITIPGLAVKPVKILSLSSGALLVMGYLKAMITWHEIKHKEKAAQVSSNTQPSQAGV